MMDRDNITRTGARAPGVERLSRSHGGVAQSAPYFDSGRRQDARQVATRRSGANYGGALIDPLHPGRPRLIGRPWSRIGENPPYGILGGTMETSASFEARSAPSSYPTSVFYNRITYFIRFEGRPTSRQWALKTLPLT